MVLSRENKLYYGSMMFYSDYNMLSGYIGDILPLFFSVLYWGSSVFIVYPQYQWQTSFIV
jgi:hypothetical protein